MLLYFETRQPDVVYFDRGQKIPFVSWAWKARVEKQLETTKFQMSNQHLGVNQILWVSPNCWPTNCFICVSTRAPYVSLSAHYEKGTFWQLPSVFHCFQLCEHMHKNAFTGQNTHQREVQMFFFTKVHDAFPLTKIVSVKEITKIARHCPVLAVIWFCIFLWLLHRLIDWRFSEMLFLPCHTIFKVPKGIWLWIKPLLTPRHISQPIS